MAVGEVARFSLEFSSPLQYCISDGNTLRYRLVTRSVGEEAHGILLEYPTQRRKEQPFASIRWDKRGNTDLVTIWSRPQEAGSFKLKSLPDGSAEFELEGLTFQWLPVKEGPLEFLLVDSEKRKVAGFEPANLPNRPKASLVVYADCSGDHLIPYIALTYALMRKTVVGFDHRDIPIGPRPELEICDESPTELFIPVSDPYRAWFYYDGEIQFGLISDNGSRVLRSLLVLYDADKLLHIVAEIHWDTQKNQDRVVVWPPFNDGGPFSTQLSKEGTTAFTLGQRRFQWCHTEEENEFKLVDSEQKTLARYNLPDQDTDSSLTLVLSAPLDPSLSFICLSYCLMRKNGVLCPPRHSYDSEKDALGADQEGEQPVAVSRHASKGLLSQLLASVGKFFPWRLRHAG